MMIDKHSTHEPLAVRARDAAKILGVSERTLAKFVAAGEIPSAKIGKSRLFRVAALEQWLRDQEGVA